ncbi:MAG: mandelate racemase/muconate lactonizing enzyme family protein [Lentisphaeria bacterium]|nr:mandelate racemase/muconate lactonizing enzyme family protein [Lentisphaeria bacterium]
MNVKFISVKLRLPLKFGAEVIDSLKVVHVELDAYGAVGRGETPLSAAWAWPGRESFSYRENLMSEFCCFLQKNFPVPQCDPMSAGYAFLTGQLPGLLDEFNREHHCAMPHLAALICLSAFDIAMHDAWGLAHNMPTYRMYNRNYLEHDLAWFFKDEKFTGLYPEDFFVKEIPAELPVWHLVGGKDLLDAGELDGTEIDDGFPVTLTGWIKRDGLSCLKIKLTGSDADWDYNRLVAVGKIALEYRCRALSPDFNCLVKDPEYVNAILDKLQREYPEIFALLLYVEQPFPYDLEAHRIDVHSCSQRKPLFMDESAHDWELVKLGYSLGWNGVALKVCKTQTGALLSACWAKAHGMQLMVQDLTNPMLATVPHILLAAHVGTIMGVECNAPQFCPAASLEMELLRPGVYTRRNGTVKTAALLGNGLGY